MTEPTETPRPTISPSTQESKVTEADNDETRVQVIEVRLEAYKKNREHL